jgi:hypothetical protein
MTEWFVYVFLLHIHEVPDSIHRLEAGYPDILYILLSFQMKGGIVSLP